MSVIGVLSVIGVVGLLVLYMIFVILMVTSLLVSIANFYWCVKEEHEGRKNMQKVRSLFFFMCFLTFLSVIVAAEYFIPKLLI